MRHLLIFGMAQNMLDKTTDMEERSGMPDTNKRADFRFPVSPMVVSFNKEQTRFFGVGLNISRSGMFFQTPEHMDVGEVFQVKFTLPKTDTTVTCRSKVVWCRSFNSMRRGSTHAGLQFVDIEPGVAEYLARMAQQHERHKTH